MDKQMKIAVVGVGLIGGSFALTLKEKGLAAEVVGVDNSEPNRNKALELGLVDRFEELPAAVAGADLIRIGHSGQFDPAAGGQSAEFGGR